MDVERLQEALKDFEKRGKKEVCPILDQFLCHVAKTGETMVQWSQFKGYFIFKLEKVMDDFRTSAPEPRGPPNPNVEYIPFEEMKERILKIVTGFNGSNVNGPGTPRPVSRTKVSLSTPMTTNGLPDSTEHKEPSLQQTEEKKHSESPASESEGAQSSPVKNKHSEDDPAEAEGHEVKRLKFDKEGEARDAPNQTASSEVSSGMGEETEASSTSQDKEKDATCARQHCTEEEEEESFMSPRNVGQDRKDQEKDSDSSSVAEESSEENNQMEESDQPRAEKDLHSADSDISASATSGADCSDTEELGSYASETPENSSETPMENSDEATEAADEPMEQD
ncbi:PREDICTED: serine/threonine-protein phosphatase 4 regulatory subunit 2 isoform X2 [Sturnus vulgaris]|uniref:serine/threonine-protein phosphatase 4 regulatory subunit 2 isoform X2 n=1 Tax=Sturnus vulgaris TaxID=9172 RepID=UPI00071A97E6|nr:PREDICTED: serine/threonine-protein phosphatase 4 regulatory subunit 2 isoform X2 [Sturnus vulgaris]